jgi:hypothetical protein
MYDYTGDGIGCQVLHLLLGVAPIYRQILVYKYRV